ncbi:MAG: OmpA family protein [Bacteroidia bacterium]|nr:OmpA family protein [Bacteroidia bacterium]MDW8302627.1 OmpA family protein [Bacteroidia bacterium]
MIRLCWFALFLVFLVGANAQTPVFEFEKEVKPSGFVLQNVKGKFSYVTTAKGSRKVYVFEPNQGFTLQVPNVFLKGVYTIEMVLQLSEVESYARILNFGSPSSDAGIYARHSTVVFYPNYKSDLRILRPNNWFHLTLVRCANSVFAAYINGELAFEFKDNLKVCQLQYSLIFFDDDGSESRSGILGTLNLFQECLEQSQIAQRAKKYLEEYGQKKIPASTEKTQQTYYEYRFEGNFNPESGKGPVLKPVGKGKFEIENIGPCASKGVYYFEQGGGFTFENKGFIGAEHTIELYFKLDNLKSWKRILDYKNRQSDTGPYVFDNQIEFYKVAISKNFPFRENKYAHVVLVREANEMYSLYVDGMLRAAFRDINELGLISQEEVLHFFQDDLQVPNECSSGAIAFLRIYNFAISPEQIAENSQNVPCPKPLIAQNTQPPKNYLSETPKETALLTYQLNLNIVDELTQNPVISRIVIKSKEQNRQIVDTISNSVRKTVPEGMYQILVESSGYLPAQQDIAVMKGSTSKTIILKKIEVGTVATLENIYFEPNSDKIVVESYPYLLSFANYLKNNPNLKVRINGHTDIGTANTSPAYLLELSQKRADAVVNFLVRNGVNPSQLTSKGYGNTKPVASNDTPEGRAKNRRVEFEILQK